MNDHSASGPDDQTDGAISDAINGAINGASDGEIDLAIDGASNGERGSDDAGEAGPELSGAVRAPAERAPEPTPAEMSDAELDDLLVRLRTVADYLDAPPPIVDELARAVFETRDLDAELAVLIADSEFDTLELVRGPTAEARLIAFETDSVTVDLQLERHDGGTLTLRGLLVGAVGEVVVDTGRTQTTHPLDDRGWFVAEGVTATALRLRLRNADGGGVTTAWITV